MPQSKKKRTDKRLGESAPISERHRELRSKVIHREQKGRWTGLIIVSAVFALILVIIGVSYYLSDDAKYRRLTLITVDDTSITMDYFLKRTWLSGATPVSMLQALANEQLIKLGAPQYVGEVTAEDIDQELRRIAQGENATISEKEFKEWYRQLLNESGLSDSEYKEMVAASLLATRLQQYLAERMPTVAEQVHLHSILVETSKEAEKLRARWEAGEDFADLAREVSLDGESKEKGGDLGWFPRGVLDSNLEEAAFSLSTGNVSQPIPIWSDTTDPDTGEPSSAIVGYYLLMVSEKADARELDENSLQALRSRVLEGWLSEEMKFHEIKASINYETVAWINWQLSKGSLSSEEE